MLKDPFFQKLVLGLIIFFGLVFFFEYYQKTSKNNNFISKFDNEGVYCNISGKKTSHSNGFFISKEHWEMNNNDGDIFFVNKSTQEYISIHKCQN